MSLVSIAAGKIQVLVGDDNQDWSEAYVSLSLNDPEVDDSGKLPITGTLTLAVLANPPDSQDPLSSAGKLRWKKGQRIIINYQKSTGVWARHPRGWLYIAQPPNPPQIGYPAYLEISVVCALQLQTFPVPRGIGASFIPNFPELGGLPTNFLTRADIVAQALQRAGLSVPWIGAIPKFPLAIAVPKDDNNAYTEFAGKVAYGGLAVLQQNNQGQLTAYPANLTTAAPLLTLDESQVVSLEFLDGGETPCEKIVFNASQEVTVRLFASYSFTDVAYGDASAVDPALLGSNTLIRRTTVSTTIDSSSKVITENISAPLGLVSPTAYPKSLAEGVDCNKTSTWQYEGGKLLSHTVRETGLFARFCSAYLGRLKEKPTNERAQWAGVTVERITSTTYDYDGDTLSSQITQVTEPLAAIVTDEKLTNPVEPKSSFFQSRSWTKRGDREWTFSQTTLIPLAKRGVQLKETSASNRAAIKSALIVDGENTFTQTSNTGQTAPPAVERPSAETEKRTIPLDGAASFTVTTTPFAPRERQYSLDVGVSGSDQLTELAQLEGARLLGRAQSVRVQVPLLDVFVDNPAPLQNFALYRTEVLPTGKRRNLYLYQMDGLGFEHEADKAVVTVTGIWLGTIEGDLVPHTSTPTDPAFNSDKVQAIYDQVTLSNSDDTSTDVVIVPPPILNFPTSRGLGFGREIVIDYGFPPVTLTIERGLGFGRNLGKLSSALDGPGLGVGRELIFPPLLPSTNPPLNLQARGLGSGREIYVVPLIYTLEPGFGWGRIITLAGLREFVYSGTPGDAAGICYFAGTNWGTQSWTNPHNASRVICATSAIASGSLSSLVSRSVDTFRTTNVANSWIRLDFGSTRAVRPTTYVLQHDLYATAYLRSWKFQGSNDSTTWTDLDTQVGNTSLNAANAWAAFSVTATTEYRYLRLLQTDLNSDGTNTLALGEIEVYGIYDY